MFHMIGFLACAAHGRQSSKEEHIDAHHATARAGEYDN